MTNASMTLLVAISALSIVMHDVPASGQHAQPTGVLPLRRYREGETLSYRMTTSNRGRTNTLNYTITAKSTVVKDADGKFFEEVAWSDMNLGGQPFAMPPASQSFRQKLTLEPNPRYLGIPNLAAVHPLLIGPITDLLTFYADILVSQQRPLAEAGAHFLFERGTPASWADGQHVTIGEDSIDFDVTLQAVDRLAHTATLLVRHLPPAHPQIRIPAGWMRAPVADTANNWINIERKSAGTVGAAIGKETFDVLLTLSLDDGRILSASLDNPVHVMERECDETTLEHCGEPVRYEILRHVEIVSSS